MAMDGDVTLIDVPTWLDLLTIIVAALGGALFAARRGVTVTGVLLIAVAAGLGGGMIRDVLLDVGPPLAISDRAYLPAAAIAAVCGMLLARWSARLAWPMLLLDSLAIGLFAVVGVERTLAADYPPASAVLIGVIAAIAGGIIRDLLAGDAPAIMAEGPWDASAALVGSVIMVVLVAGTRPAHTARRVADHPADHHTGGAVGEARVACSDGTPPGPGARAPRGGRAPGREAGSGHGHTR